MLQLIQAGKRFGQKLLYEDINWLITPNERTGLVGGNGTGKSTLLKVIGGFDSLDYGEITRVKGTTIGYLPQDGLAMRGKTVFDECLSIFEHLHAMERESIELMTVMSEKDPKSKEYHEAADRYSEIADHLHVHDVYTLDSQVGAVLGGLGFSKEDWARKTEEFSGGWQMRIALAKLLLQKPSLLLLDEPTNHLDIESRNWLEEYLHDYPNAFILISHDRYFLDVTVNKTIELWNKRMHVYHGNYEKYVTQKEERRTQLMNAYKNQRDRIEALEAFINRFRYQATKAKQVQSRIRELEKIERIEVPEEEATIHFTIPQPPASGRTVIEVENLTKIYPMPDGGEKTVLDNVSFTIERGDRIALVGANGAGKSTLIRMLSDQEAPTSGAIRYGHNAIVDFFAQDQYKVLDHNAEMLEDIAGAAPKVPVVELRSLLGCFMFSGDDVFKKLGVLSGGERNRYAMAKMLVSPSNMLLLDEPTNHLDLRAKDVLLDAIRNFTGTVLFVSHDRYFIDGLATRVFEVEDRRVHIYPGNYEDYLWRKQGGPDKVKASLTADLKPTPPPTSATSLSSRTAAEGPASLLTTRPNPLLCYAFAAACALNVLTEGLIGIVFPIAIVLTHLLLTRRTLRATLTRLWQLRPISSTVIFLAIAAPWHILNAQANPTQGHPGNLGFAHGLWSITLPTGDTVPLALFWLLLLVWLMPWSGFLFHALAKVPWRKALRPRISIRTLTPTESTRLLLGLWAAVPLVFFSFSTRQEYYVLPALPALILLIAAWLAEEADEAESFIVPNPLTRSGQRISVVLLSLGSLAALVAGFFALHAQPPGPNTDLAALLKQNPADYALSFGHFLDLNAQAMGAFHDPLVLTAIALFVGTVANWLLRRNYRPHAANLWLAAATFTFLFAAHLGLRIFSPVLTSRQLAAAIAPVIKPDDLIVIHGEYEAASTLGFYLRRPGPETKPIHILNGRSSNLWYGSFFSDAPPIFEDDVSLSLKWTDVRRIFLWQDLSKPLPSLPGPAYFIAQSGGKEILSNQPNPY